MSTPQFATGDLTILDPRYASPRYHGVVFRVVKVMPVNLLLEPATGGRKIKANKDLCRPAPQDAPVTAGPTAVGVPYLPPLWEGTVVTVAGPGWKQPPERLYVVIREKLDKVHITTLGGDQGRYWRMPRSFLTRVDIAHLRHTPPAPRPAADGPTT